MHRHHRCAIWLFVGFLALAVAPHLRAQEPELNGPAQDYETPQEMVQAAYKLTAAAETEKEFGRIIMLLDRAQRTDELDTELEAYAGQLKGWCFNKRGEALADQGREGMALKHFEAAVNLNGNHWKARHNRGVSYAVLGRYQEAMQDFTHTIRLNPDYANARYNRGELYYKTGKMDKAIRDYTEAIKLKPQDAGYYHARGNVYHRQSQFDEALDDYDRAIRLAPNNADYCVFRGDAYAELGNYDDAAADYRKAVEMDGQLGSAFRSIAWLMATCPDDRFRDSQRGVATARKAMQLSREKDHRYLETLAAALANAGQFDDAAKTQRDAIDLAEDDASISQLDAMRLRLGQYQRKQPFRQERIARRGSENERTR